ncbi:wall-associated receptor kinase 3-like [Triticum dicoccoides]|uniref:wall-associated receptor kinase 3-like n=1 Tax=Triticum dicoccoides TaxID=85692 RepID=UPI0018916545|nr:wall-associated receptor kinase 3-like [Triticum dicoccoides]
MAHHTTIVFSAAAALLLLLLAPCAEAAASPAPVIGMPGCETRCGDMVVPYPFGMGPSYCYLPGFNLTCDWLSDPPRPLLGDGTLQVAEDIGYPSDATLAVVHARNIPPTATGMAGSAVALAMAGRTRCRRPGTSSSGLGSSMLCSGMGCCQAPIVVNCEVAAGGKLAPITSYDVELESFGRNRSDGQRWPARVFVAKKGWITTWSASKQLSSDPQAAADMEVPLWLNWENLQEQPANHTRCTRGDRGGYLCSCKQGYQGNAYITNGCQDIDECKHAEFQINRCHGQCTNTDGAFQCRCPQGTHGDPYMPGGCFSLLTDSCSRLCGNMSVPYPFGIGSHKCYLPGFNLTCDTSYNPARLMLGTLQVVDISLHNSTVRVINSNRVHGIYGGVASVNVIDFGISHGDNVPYPLSTRTELIVIGCGVQAGLSSAGNNRVIISSCSSFCSSNKSRAYDARSSPNIDDNGEYCYGNGCCQAQITMSRDGMASEFWIDWMDPNSVWDEALPHSYALIAEEGWFNKHWVYSQLSRSLSTKYLAPRLEVQIVLDWEILQLQPINSHAPANVSWHHQYAMCPGICRSKNSLCKPRIKGYSCHCSDGYDGNPYTADGCKGSRRKQFKGTSAVVGVVVAAAGVVLLFLLGLLIMKKLKYERAKMLKRKFFKQNHGQLLQQFASQSAGIAERMIITLEELEKATHYFDNDLVVGGGGHGIVYKGILSNQHIVAIKKPKNVVRMDINEFINEVAILSQINHRNVVKLYGCCLETEVPMLVYEFISNGTLYEHLHVEGPKSLSWDNRLQIAIEAAKSLAYLHSAASIPIIHRDVKSANIWLDDTLTAKVADFGASKYIPMDISGVTTRAQGTRGYWDPMYFYTGRLTEKSDVYSFGVVLVELLTRKKPFSYLSSNDESLVAHFVTLFEGAALFQILDPQVMEEGGKEVEKVASIAVACVKLTREDRPTMRQVELTLEGTRVPREGTSDNASPSTEVESNTGGSTRRHSMELEFRLSAERPR